MIGYFFIVIFLMFVNWGIEAIKWKVAIAKIQKVPFTTAFKAVLSGLSFSMNTPNGIGEYMGRVLYLDEGNKIKGVSVTIVSSMSQLIITLIMGVIGLLFIRESLTSNHLLSAIWYQVFLYGSLAVTAVMILFYFKISWIVQLIDRAPFFKKYSWAIEALESFEVSILIKFLTLSLTRFLVFVLQYFLLFRLFDVDISVVQNLFAVSCVFLVMAIVPTIAIFTDLGIKNEVSLKIVGIYSANHLGISLATFGIWLINLVIPSIIGSLLILGIKSFIKRNDEII